MYFFIQKCHRKTKKYTSQHIYATMNLINSLVMPGIQIKNMSAEKLQHELQHFALLCFILVLTAHWLLLVLVKNIMFEAQNKDKPH